MNELHEKFELYIETHNRDEYVNLRFQYGGLLFARDESGVYSTQSMRIAFEVFKVSQVDFWSRKRSRRIVEVVTLFIILLLIVVLAAAFKGCA